MRKNYINTFGLAIMMVALASCGTKNESKTEAPIEEPNTISGDEWISLFDGETLDGWRSYNMDSLATDWTVVDGMLKSHGMGSDLEGDIIYSLQEFEDFELSLEWKISEGGNSGIFYHVVEGDQYKAIYEAAPEYQLLDDLGFPEPVKDWQQLGADYAMYPADPEQKIVKKAGEWNTSRILFTKEKAEYWLNGQKVVGFVPWSDDWTERRNSGKWDDMPDYGKAKKGYIGLQDHGNVIWFKNIKIKEL